MNTVELLTALLIGHAARFRGPAANRYAAWPDARLMQHGRFEDFPVALVQHVAAKRFAALVCLPKLMVGSQR
jgi:hypothetical protein